MTFICSFRLKKVKSRKVQVFNVNYFYGPEHQRTPRRYPDNQIELKFHFSSVLSGNLNVRIQRVTIDTL